MTSFLAEENSLIKIAKNFEHDVSANLAAYIKAYSARFAKRIDVDSARELCPAYANSYKNRARLAPLIHEPASQIVKAVWHALLNESFGETGFVIFLAGGSGSGKSTVVQSKKFQNAFRDAIVIYDSTFSSYASANIKIQEGLSAGKDVDIYYIHRNAKDAAYSVVERAVRSGRTIPIQEIAKIHWGSQNTIFELCEQYKDSENVTIYLFDNSNSGSAESIGLFNSEQDLLSIRYRSRMVVEALVEDGAAAAYAHIREEHGSFPAAIALGIFGKEHPFD